MKIAREKLINNFNIISMIALKDVVDAVRSRLVISLIVGAGIMLLLPRMMSLVFEEPSTPIVVYDPGGSGLVATLNDSNQFSVHAVGSYNEFETNLSTLGFGLGPELGLIVPEDLDQRLEAGGAIEITGYVSWANRFKAVELKAEFEEKIGNLVDQPVNINVEGHFIYPQPDSLASGLTSILGITVVLTMGISLVPYLLLEEKQTKTIDALLVSPASISQVVIGKALVGLFYVLVIAGVIFALNWNSVTHWDVAILFSFGSGIFAVAVGLVLGSYFEGQQEITGWISALTIFLVGALYVKLLGLDIPVFMQSILPYVPSVALGEVYRFALIENVNQVAIWSNLGIVLGISTTLYFAVIWRIHRIDR